MPARRAAAGDGTAGGTHQTRMQDHFPQNKRARAGACSAGNSSAAGGGAHGRKDEQAMPHGRGLAPVVNDFFSSTSQSSFGDDEDCAHALSQTPTQPDVDGEEGGVSDVDGGDEAPPEGGGAARFEFYDSVHGDMKRALDADPGIMELCGTGPFQRLLETKQLGVCFHVFASATHTRAEHSVGVCYLASRMLNSLTRSIADLHATWGGSVPLGCPAQSLPEPPDHIDRFCVLAAALGHDLGHGAFSHLFEHIVHEVVNKAEWSHEAMSVTMLERALQERLQQAPRGGTEGELKEEDFRFIFECILGKDLHAMPATFQGEQCTTAAECREARRGRGRTKEYLYDIVSNVHSGLDVDKIDYLMRDPHVLGPSHAFKTRAQRLKDLCEHASVRWCREGTDCTQGRWGICWPETLKDTADLVFRHRF